MNRLQEEFSSDIAFEYLNAADNGTGEALFMQLGLRGHPAIVLFDAAGNEVFRSFGSVEEDTLRELLVDL